MKFNAKEIGKRIKEAREARGIRTQKALADRLRQASETKSASRAAPKLKYQSVQQWESGSHIPPWDKVELLAEVLGPNYGEEWLMFGSKRTNQLASERPFLSYISTEEQELLNAYRHANMDGKKSIISTAKTLAATHPVPAAEIHPLRRKTDPHQS